jgi:DNA invertase Pin-like site-specific DNA recombinase
MASGKFVAYFRVSTDQQGASGLGLEAQRKAVIDFLNGGDWELEAEFVEIESGKRNDRPQLDEALAQCKKIGATLVIARLDRLARNVHFISGLMEAGVDFVAADMPNADRFMLHVYAAMSEHEGRRISERTKAALAAAKERGTVLGSHGAILARQNAEAADTAATALRATVEAIRADGFNTVAAITDELNRRAVPTARGGRWHTTSVQRLLTRLRG